MKAIVAAALSVVALSGCDMFGNTALLCSGNEVRISDGNIRQSNSSDLPATVIKDFLGSPKSIYLETKLGSNFDAPFCETTKSGSQVFKFPNCKDYNSTLTLFPEHGRLKVFYLAKDPHIDDKYDADLTCVKAKGLK